MAEDPLAKNIQRTRVSQRKVVVPESLIQRIVLGKVPQLEKGEEFGKKPTFKEEFSRFIITGELVAGMDLIKINRVITKWVERIETKYGKKRENGAIEGKSRENLSGIYELFANIVTQNSVEWEPYGLSWAKSQRAEKVRDYLLDSTELVSREDVFQPLEELEKIALNAIEIRINKIMKKAKEGGTYSEREERQLRENVSDMATASAVLARRALAVMYLTEIAPNVVEGFEIKGMALGERILLARCDEKPAWEERYTPWHEAVHLLSNRGEMKTESPLTYAMNYLPLFMERNPQALKKAKSAREFRPEDLLIGDLDPGAREAGLALAVRMTNFCDELVRDVDKTFGRTRNSLTPEGKEALHVYFLQIYVNSIAGGKEPRETENRLAVDAKSWCHLLEEYEKLSDRAISTRPEIEEVIGVMNAILTVYGRFSFDVLGKVLEQEGERELKVNPETKRMIKEFADCCTSAAPNMVSQEETLSINRISWKLFHACIESLSFGFSQKEITAHIRRLSEVTGHMKRIKRGAKEDENDPLATTLFVLASLERYYPQDMSLSEGLENLKKTENRAQLMKFAAWLNPVSDWPGKTRRRFGVDIALRIIEFCCEQGNRLESSADESLKLFREYGDMLRWGYMPSLIETMIRIEVDCDLRAIKEASGATPK